MTVKEFMERMNHLAPFESALEWDNVGLLLGNENSQVNKVFVCLDVSDETIKEASRNRCDLILSHHPLLFKPVKRVLATENVGRKIMEMVVSGLNYAAMHTNFDVHVMGGIVSERIGFSTFDVLTITGEWKTPLGIGTVSDLVEPIELRDLVEHIKNTMLIPFCTYFGEDDTLIKRAAIVPGAGSSEVENAIKAGADVLITGDVSHHTGIDAVASGLNIIDAGHYGLEHIFIEYMEEYINKHIPEIGVYTEKIKYPRRLS